MREAAATPHPLLEKETVLCTRSPLKRRICGPACTSQQKLWWAIKTLGATKDVNLIPQVKTLKLPK